MNKFFQNITEIIFFYVWDFLYLIIKNNQMKEQKGSEWLAARYGENGRISMTDEAQAREIERVNSLNLVRRIKSLVKRHSDWLSHKPTDGGKYSMEDLMKDIEGIENELKI